jgi:hypothetical protein
MLTGELLASSEQLPVFCACGSTVEPRLSGMQSLTLRNCLFMRCEQWRADLGHGTADGRVSAAAIVVVQAVPGAHLVGGAHDPAIQLLCSGGLSQIEIGKSHDLAAHFGGRRRSESVRRECIECESANERRGEMFHVRILLTGRFRLKCSLGSGSSINIGAPTYLSPVPHL